MVKEWLGGWNGEGAWEGDREKGRIGGSSGRWLRERDGGWNGEGALEGG
jgi:hypothetical protein